MSKIPDNLRYTKDHEWIRIDGKRAVIGITDFAQSELTDVVYVEPPKVGKVVKAGEVLGTVESVKAVSELFSPVAGEVLEMNADLVKKPELVNSDPHGAAWMIVVRLADPKAVGALMDAKGYQALVESESK